MIYIIVFSGIFCLHLILKLNWISAVFVCLVSLIMIPVHMKLEKKRIYYGERFFEISLYLDTLLYAFAKEGKADRAMQDAKMALPEGNMKQIVTKALDYMFLTFDEVEVLRESFRMIEQEYPCKRITDVHEFMIRVEYCGGDVEKTLNLLLLDKNRWEKRIKRMMAERNKQMMDIILSVAVSLLICGVIMYLPVMNIDISENAVVQVFSLIVIFVDDLIIIKAQSYLAIDWGALQIAEDEEVATKKMKSFREYNEQSERKLSFLLGSIAIIITAIFFLQGKEWHGAGGLLLTIFFLNQHKIGRNLARKTLTREIKYAFSGWLLDLALLLQSENVQVALEKSKLYVPGVLKVELFELVERLEKEPESAEPYHQFLQIFMIPEIHSAMSILYSLSIGNSGNADKQISELVEKNLEILDISEEEKIRNMGSGMYLLFLAPVLTASFKLLVDMVFLMLGFLQSSSF